MKDSLQLKTKHEQRLFQIYVRILTISKPMCIGYNNLPKLTDRLPLSHLGVHELSPAGMMIEVADNEGNIRITRLANRLPVVQSLDHTECNK